MRLKVLSIAAGFSKKSEIHKTLVQLAKQEPDVNHVVAFADQFPEKSNVRHRLYMACAEFEKEQEEKQVVADRQEAAVQFKTEQAQKATDQVQPAQ